MDNITKEIKNISNKNSVLILSFLGLTVLFTGIVETIINISASGELQKYEMLLVAVVQYFAALPLAVLMVSFKERRSLSVKLRSLFCRPSASKKDIAKWIMISLFFVYATSYFTSFLFEIIQLVFKIELNSIDFTAENSALGIFTNIFFMVISAPICEEIFFRGILSSRTGEYGTWAAVISTGILFGLFHMNYAQVFYASMLGFCSAFMLFKTRSLIPSLILHLSLNTIGAAQSIAAINVDVEKLNQGDTEYIVSNISAIMPILAITLLVIAIMITGLVFLVLELQNSKEKFRLENNNTTISEVQKTKIYFLTPTTIITVVILIAITIINALM